MKILIISAFPPCQNTAGQDYTRRLILDLINKEHKISIIYTNYLGHSCELPGVSIIHSYNAKLTNCLKIPIYHPFFTKRFDNKILNKIVNIANNFDMLYFDFSQVHIYSKLVNHPNKVLMCHDVIAQKFSRKGMIQLPWIKFTEKKLLETGNKIITFSEKDSNYIKRIYNLSSIPVNFYLKNGEFNYSNGSILFDNTFCFYGAWNRPENYKSLNWFFTKIYPKITDKNINFLVIGGGLPNKLYKKLQNEKSFKILGFVENPLLEISKCQALIAPLKKGAGVKVKVIDALSTGTSVIGSAIAFEGIQDNTSNSLLYLCTKENEYIDLLTNWNNKTINKKQIAASEFYSRYNKNHFVDYL